MRLTGSLPLALLALCAAQTEELASPAALTERTGSGGKGIVGKVFGSLKSHTASKGGKIKSSGAISSAKLLSVSGLRASLLNFYCPTHQTLFPCMVRRAMPCSPARAEQLHGFGPRPAPAA
jgi:hypothetical protein